MTSDTQRSDEVTEDEIRSRAKDIIKRMGWLEQKAPPSLYSTMELMVALGLDLLKNRPASCGYPECGCDFDAVCNVALVTPPKVGSGELDAAWLAKVIQPTIRECLAHILVAGASDVQRAAAVEALERDEDARDILDGGSEMIAEAVARALAAPVDHPEVVGDEHHEFVADPYRPSQCVNCGRSPAARIHDAQPSDIPALEAGMAWQTMDSAPMDGKQFIAVEYRPHAMYPRIYYWEGPPNYWRAVEGGVCIRPQYQQRYLWAPLPTALSIPAKEDQ